jgi:hypothetical protein
MHQADLTPELAAAASRESAGGGGVERTVKWPRGGHEMVTRCHEMVTRWTRNRRMQGLGSRTPALAASASGAREVEASRELRMRIKSSIRSFFNSYKVVLKESRLQDSHPAVILTRSHNLLQTYTGLTSALGSGALAVAASRELRSGHAEGTRWPSGVTR